MRSLKEGAPTSVRLASSAALACALLLGACGGGGGSVAPSSSPNIGPAPSVPPSVYQAPAVALVASVPAPAYPVGSEELAAFETLNAVRSHCGFGLLAQNLKLDAAAVGHSDWLIRNGYGGHFQEAGLPGFTGVTPMDRGASSGYGQPSDVSVTNLLAGSHGPGASKAGYGKKSVYMLLNAPYHGVGMLSGALEIGVAVRDHHDLSSPVGPRVQSDFDLGYRYATGSQEPAADAVLTFPCDGSTDVDRDLTNEDPNPVPGRDLAVQPLGTSVIVRVRRGQMLKITRASMTETLTGKVVALRAPVSTAHGNDPHGSLDIWEAYVAADRPLLPRTQYSAQLEGTNDGRVFSRNFTFTTGD